MADWKIDGENNKHVQKLGQAEFDRRLAIANTKAENIKCWKEKMFLRPQFHAIAMQLSPEQMKTAEGWPGQKWAKLVYKLAAA